MDTSESPLRILSVEDNPEMHLLLDHMLDGYDVVFVSGVDEALTAIESESFDVLLLDIHLGSGKNGTDLLHTFRDRQDGEKVPAIAVTAYAMPGDREDFLDKGFDGYVSKPFTRAELTAAMDRVL